MKKVNPPKGMRDVLPADFILREKLMSTIRRVYESYGYLGMDTPALERIEFLSNKSGEETEQLMFKVLKRGEKLDLASDELADMGLRYDLTISLCRYYATNFNSLPKIFRRYQISPVWRADRPQHGRFREFYQCDVDFIGDSSIFPECEVIMATLEALNEIGLKNHFIKISDRTLLPAIFKSMGFDDTEIKRAMISVDKLDKINVDGVISESKEYLSERNNNSFKEFLTDITRSDQIEINANSLGKWGLNCENEIAPILNKIRSISEVIKQSANHPVDVKFWPSLVRGMAYYTGPIFEIWDNQHPFSLSGGGRYDDMVGIFLGKNIPACGFSIGFERILTILKEKETTSGNLSRTKVLIALRSENSEAEGLQIADQLRKEGIYTEVYPYAKKIVAQFKHAEELSIPLLLIPQESRDKERIFELIDNFSKEKVTGDITNIINRIKQKLRID